MAHALERLMDGFQERGDVPITPTFVRRPT